MNDQTAQVEQPSFFRHLVRTILTSYQFWMITTALMFGYMIGRAVG